MTASFQIFYDSSFSNNTSGGRDGKIANEMECACRMNENGKLDIEEEGHKSFFSLSAGRCSILESAKEEEK
jgi:hypothetical protein